MQELPAELRGSTAILRIRFDKHFRRQLKIDFREDRRPEVVRFVQSPSIPLRANTRGEGEHGLVRNDRMPVERAAKPQHLLSTGYLE